VSPGFRVKAALVAPPPTSWWGRLLQFLKHLLEVDVGLLKNWLIGGGALAAISALFLWFNSTVLKDFFNPQQIAQAAGWLAGIIVVLLTGHALTTSVPQATHDAAVQALKESAPAQPSAGQVGTTTATTTTTERPSATPGG